MVGRSRHGVCLQNGGDLNYAVLYVVILSRGLSMMAAVVLGYNLPAQWTVAMEKYQGL